MLKARVKVKKTKKLKPVKIKQLWISTDPKSPIQMMMITKITGKDKGNGKGKKQT